MMKKLTGIASIITSMVFISMSALAGDVGVGATVGTDGIAIQGKMAVSPRISVTAGYNYFKFSKTREYDGVEYDGKFDYSNIAAFVNYHPFGNGFKLEGGGYYGDKSLALLGTPAGMVQIGDVSYTASEVGTLSGVAKLNDFAPYVGIGYDAWMFSDKQWSFNARAGVMFVGSVEAELSSTGLLATNPNFLIELTKEVKNLESDLDGYKYYPVISLGVSRNF